MKKHKARNRGGVFLNGTNPPKIKVAAYARVSTDKEDQIASLETQKEFFEEYARIHCYELTKLYADEGISGTKLKNRFAFHEMMEDAKKGKFQKVFVKDISRFARNAVDFLNSIRNLKAMGIPCEFVNSNLSTEDGEFTLGILALVAQEESANLSKRVKFGKTKNAQRGKVPNLVYGYNKITGQLFDLEINQEEAKIVREIYSLYTEEGYGSNKIAQILNERGITTKRQCQWSQNAVCRILTNPIYIGKVINGKEEVENFLTGVRKKKQEESWIIKENPNLVILEEEIFQRAQRKIKDKRQKFCLEGKRESGKYLFSTLIKCETCGYYFRRIHKKFVTKDYIKWVCSGRNTKGKDFCKNHTVIDEKELQKEILDYFLQIAGGEKEVISRMKKESFTEIEKIPIVSEQKEIEKELEKLKKAKRKQIEMYEQEVISLEELKERTKQLNKEIKQKEQHLQKRVQRGMEYKKTEPFSLPENLDNHLLKQLIDKIIVKEDGEIEVILKELS